MRSLLPLANNPDKHVWDFCLQCPVLRSSRSQSDCIWWAGKVLPQFDQHDSGCHYKVAVHMVRLYRELRAMNLTSDLLVIRRVLFAPRRRIERFRYRSCTALETTREVGATTNSKWTISRNLSINTVRMWLSSPYPRFLSDRIQMTWVILTRQIENAHIVLEKRMSSLKVDRLDEWPDLVELFLEVG